MPRRKLVPRFPAHKTLSGHHTVPFTPDEIAALTGHAVEQQLDNHGFPPDTIDDEDVRITHTLCIVTLLQLSALCPASADTKANSHAFSFLSGVLHLLRHGRHARSLR